MLKNDNLDRRMNEYMQDFSYTEEAELMADIADMEANSTWHHDVKTSDILLTAISAPMDANPVAKQFNLDPTLALEAAGIDSLHLVVSLRFNGEEVPPPYKSHFVADNTAWGTIKNAAKLDGSALGRMDPKIMAEVLNDGLFVARGYSLVLERYDKCFAIHSDNYLPMPISELISEAKEVLKKEFGEMAFCGGHNEHAYTSCLWELPDSRDKLLQAYQDELNKAVKKGVAPKVHYASDFTPGIRFYSSDTASSAARLIPVFITRGGVEVRLVDGIAVRHEMTSSSKYGMELFREKAGEMYAQFTSAAEKAGELSKVFIYNSANCVTSLCKKFNIPKKYGSLAVEEIQTAQGSDTSVTALDIYIAMSNMVEYAKAIGATDAIALELQEKVAKVLKVTDWNEHDVTGNVAW